MSLKEFVALISQYLVDYLTKKFTGKIILTLNIKDGGIGNVHVSIDHQLTKDNKNAI